MAIERSARITAIEDQLTELHIQQKKAKSVNDWHRIFAIQMAINCANVELTELRRDNPAREL